MDIVNFRNINVAYEEKNVLNNINLSIKEAEHTAILGANGSGKSTLIKLFSNDIYPRFSEELVKEVFGQKIWDIWELKKHLGIITNDLHYEFTLVLLGLEVLMWSCQDFTAVFISMTIKRLVLYM